MPTDQPSHSSRRQNFHRGRRGQERRGERRPPPASQPQGNEPARGEQVDVDQIVKEIKARISQRHGIDLSGQQIQELAARRLEAILDPRTIKPSLLEQLRRSAGAPADVAPVEPVAAYTFEDHTIFDSHNGLLRLVRGLLKPILKLFFNPNPLAHALNAQARLNREAARREEERERTQAEWNALHYTILQRMVTEVSRVSIEVQSLALRVESLAARADFNERRVRSLETTPAPPQPQRIADVAAGAGAPAPPSPAPRAPGDAATAEGQSEGARRRRRRRRGRRGTGPGDGPGDGQGGGPADQPDQPDQSELPDQIDQAASQETAGADDDFEEGPDEAPEPVEDRPAAAASEPPPPTDPTDQ